MDFTVLTRNENPCASMCEKYYIRMGTFLTACVMSRAVPCPAFHHTASVFPAEDRNSNNGAFGLHLRTSCAPSITSVRLPFRICGSSSEPSAKHKIVFLR